MTQTSYRLNFHPFWMTLNPRSLPWFFFQQLSSIDLFLTLTIIQIILIAVVYPHFKFKLSNTPKKRAPTYSSKQFYTSISEVHLTKTTFKFLITQRTTVIIRYMYIILYYKMYNFINQISTGLRRSMTKQPTHQTPIHPWCIREVSQIYLTNSINAYFSL